jgi:hypothetical protein
MTNDLPILALTGLLTVFFLLSVLLFILYSRNLVQLKTELEANVTHNESYKDLYRVYQESLQKCKELSLEYTASEVNCYDWKDMIVAVVLSLIACGMFGAWLVWGKRGKKE